MALEQISSAVLGVTGLPFQIPVALLPAMEAVLGGVLDGTFARNPTVTFLKRSDAAPSDDTGFVILITRGDDKPLAGLVRVGPLRIGRVATQDLAAYLRRNETANGARRAAILAHRSDAIPVTVSVMDLNLIVGSASIVLPALLTDRSLPVRIIGPLVQAPFAFQTFYTVQGLQPILPVTYNLSYWLFSLSYAGIGVLLQTLIFQLVPRDRVLEWFSLASVPAAAAALLFAREIVVIESDSRRRRAEMDMAREASRAL